MAVSQYAKAIVGAVIAGLSALGTGLDDGNLSTQEIVTAIIACLVALGVVFGVPNGQATSEVEPAHKADDDPADMT